MQKEQVFSTTDLSQRTIIKKATNAKINSILDIATVFQMIDLNPVRFRAFKSSFRFRIIV
jgi:hypothetical protein